MKKVLLIFFCFATMNVSAQYYGYDGYGYYNYGGPAAASAESQLNAMAMQQLMMQQQIMQQQMMQQQMMSNMPIMPQYQPDISWGNAPCYVPDCNQSSESDYDDSPQRSSGPRYESRYGDKDCYSCHGSGVCPTCNGKGWYRSSFGDNCKCPNCEYGKPGVCNTCHGRGKVYGVR